MKVLVMIALVAAAAASPVDTRNKRSYYQYSNPDFYSGSEQYYVNQASPSVYSTPLYNTQYAQPSYTVPVSQGAVYHQPSVSYSSPSYVVRQPVYSGLYPSPQVSHVSSPAIYNAEHSSQASSSSVYKVQAPASVNYAVQAPASVNYAVQAPRQYAAPSTWTVGNAGNSYLSNPWC